MQPNSLEKTDPNYIKNINNNPQEMKKILSTQPEPQRIVGDFVILETLGKGGQAWVKKGQNTKNGMVCAIKFLDKTKFTQNQKILDQIKTEIVALQKLSENKEENKHIIKLIAYNLNGQYPYSNKGKIKFIEEQEKLFEMYKQQGQLQNNLTLTFREPPSYQDVIYMVLEYMPGGELFDLLYYKAEVNERIARLYFKQIIHGLEACHNNNIVHRDLKPQNFLLDSRFSLRISDFGLSKFVKNIKKDKLSTRCVGTQGYQAPEILEGKEYGAPCDIFSIGVMLFVLLSGYPPFENATKNDYWYSAIIQGKYKEFWMKHKGSAIKPGARDLITRMIRYDPKKRSTIRKIKNHKWYTETDGVKKDDKNENPKYIDNKIDYKKQISDEEYLFKTISREFKTLKQLKQNDKTKEQILKYSQEWDDKKRGTDNPFSFNIKTKPNTFKSKDQEIVGVKDHYTTSTLFKIFSFTEFIVTKKLSGQTEYNRGDNSLKVTLGVIKNSNTSTENSNTSTKNEGPARISILIKVYKSLVIEGANLVKYKNISDETATWFKFRKALLNLQKLCKPVLKMGKGDDDENNNNEQKDEEETNDNDDNEE